MEINIFQLESIPAIATPRNHPLGRLLYKTRIRDHNTILFFPRFRSAQCDAVRCECLAWNSPVVFKGVLSDRVRMRAIGISRILHPAADAPRRHHPAVRVVVRVVLEGRRRSRPRSIAPVRLNGGPRLLTRQNPVGIEGWRLR